MNETIAPQLQTWPEAAAVPQDGERQQQPLFRATPRVTHCQPGWGGFHQPRGTTAKYTASHLASRMKQGKRTVDFIQFKHTSVLRLASESVIFLGRSSQCLRKRKDDTGPSQDERRLWPIRFSPQAPRPQPPPPPTEGTGRAPSNCRFSKTAPAGAEPTEQRRA